MESLRWFKTIPVHHIPPSIRRLSYPDGGMVDTQDLLLYSCKCMTKGGVCSFARIVENQESLEEDYVKNVEQHLSESVTRKKAGITMERGHVLYVVIR